MQVTDAAVITEPLPELEPDIFRCRGKRSYIRQNTRKPQIILLHRFHARLLQHNLRKPYVIRRRILPPRKNPAVPVIPRKQCLRAPFTAAHFVPCRLPARSIGAPPLILRHTAALLPARAAPYSLPGFSARRRVFWQAPPDNSPVSAFCGLPPSHQPYIC